MASAGIQNRPCAGPDIAAGAAVYGHHVRTGTASFEIEPPPAEDMLQRWHALQDAGYPYLVLDAAG